MLEIVLISRALDTDPFQLFAELTSRGGAQGAEAETASEGALQQGVPRVFLCSTNHQFQAPSGSWASAGLTKMASARLAMRERHMFPAPRFLPSRNYEQRFAFANASERRHPKDSGLWGASA
jgi:hypothetical protein